MSPNPPEKTTGPEKQVDQHHPGDKVPEGVQIKSTEDNRRHQQIERRQGLESFKITGVNVDTGKKQQSFSLLDGDKEYKDHRPLREHRPNGDDKSAPENLDIALFAQQEVARFEKSMVLNSGSWGSSPEMQQSQQNFEQQATTPGTDLSIAIQEYRDGLVQNAEQQATTGQSGNRDAQNKKDDYDENAHSDVKGIQNSIKVIPGALIRGANPGGCNDDTHTWTPESVMKGLIALKQAGVKTDISFETEKDDDNSIKGKIAVEKACCAMLGMNFINLAMDHGGPTYDQVNTFLTTVQKSMEDPSKGAVYCHCREGRDRTGYMVAEARVALQGVDPATAAKEDAFEGYNKYKQELYPFLQTPNIDFADLNSQLGPGKQTELQVEQQIQHTISEGKLSTQQTDQNIQTQVGQQKELKDDGEHDQEAEVAKKIEHKLGDGSQISGDSLDAQIQKSIEKALQSVEPMQSQMREKIFQQQIEGLVHKHLEKLQEQPVPVGTQLQYEQAMVDQLDQRIMQQPDPTMRGQEAAARAKLQQDTQQQQSLE